MFEKVFSSQSKSCQTALSGGVALLARAALTAVLFSAVLIPALPAYAQVPSTLVPGRQEDQRKTPELPNRAVAPALPRANLQVAPAESDQITFTLAGLRLEGAQAVPASELNVLWKEYIGTTISVATLYDIANKITQTYVDHGYALSFAFVPEQEIADGSVVLRVVEGFVDQVIIQGNAKDQVGSWPDGKRAEKSMQALTERIKRSRPLRTLDLERYLLLINERPGLSAQATFMASKTTAEASTLIVNLDYKPLDANLSTDNRMSPSLNHWSFGGTVALNGGITGSDQLRLGWRCGVFCGVYNSTSLSWSTYLGGEGAQAGFTISTSSEKPSEGILVPLQFRGSDTQVALQGSYPLIRSRQTSLDIGGSFTWSKSETETFAGPLTRDEVRTLNGYGNYSFADTTGAYNVVRLEVSQGLPIMGATEDDDALKSRAGGRADFTLAKASLARSQPLGVVSPKLSAYSIYMSAQAQAALTSPLLSVSQCFYGGSDIGRGYDSGAISGDHCAMGLVELRRDFVVKNVGLQAYAFGDAGKVWRRGALPVGETGSSFAESVGAGVRLVTSQRIQADLQVSFPIKESFASNGKDSPRAFFSLSWQY